MKPLRPLLFSWSLGISIDLLVIGASLLFFIRVLSPMFQIEGRTTYELLVLEYTTLVNLLGAPLCLLLLGGISAVYLAIFWCFTAGSIGGYVRKLLSPKN